MLERSERAVRNLESGQKTLITGSEKSTSARPGKSAGPTGGNILLANQ